MDELTPVSSFRSLIDGATRAADADADAAVPPLVPPPPPEELVLEVGHDPLFRLRGPPPVFSLYTDPQIS